MNWDVTHRMYELICQGLQFGKVDEKALSIDFNVTDQHGAPVAAVAKDYTSAIEEVFARLDVLLELNHIGLTAAWH